MLSRGQLPPIKMVSPFVACFPYDSFKISPNLHALPSPINMTTMIRQHTKIPLLLDPLGKLDHQQTIHYPKATQQYWGAAPLTRCLHCVWFLFDPKVTGSIVSSLVPRPRRVWTKILLILNEAPQLNSPWVKSRNQRIDHY